MSVYVPLDKAVRESHTAAENKPKPFSTAYYDKVRASAAHFVDFVATKMAPNQTTSVEDLASLSSFDEGSMFIDKVKTSADNHFIELVQYFTDAKVLEIMGWEKPTPHPRLLEIASSAKVVEWYKKYSVLYVHYLASRGVANKVRVKILEEDIQKLTSTKIYAKQTNAIFHFSYLERNPKLAVYLKDADNWAAKLKDYYLSNKFMEEWVHSIKSQMTNEATFKLYSDLLAQYGHDKEAQIIANIPKEYNTLNHMISDVRNKMDLLDPSGKTSNLIIQKMYGVNYGLMVYMTDLDGNQDYFNSADKQMDDVLNKLSQLRESELSGAKLDMYKIYKDVLLSCGGNPAGIKFQLGYAIKKTVSRMKPYTNITGDWNNIVNMPTIETENMKTSMTETCPDLIKKVPKALTFFMTMWRGAQFLSILYGVYNYDPKSSAISQASFIGDTTAIILDTFTTFQKVDRAFTAPFVKFANWFTKGLSVFKPNQLSKLFSVGLKWFFTASFNEFLNFRVCPAILVLACIMNGIDIVNDIDEKNWGKLVCDIVQLGCNVAAIVVLVAGCSWSGPVALILGGVCIIASLVKYIFEKSPAEKFVESSYFLPKYNKAVPITA